MHTYSVIHIYVYCQCVCMYINIYKQNRVAVVVLAILISLVYSAIGSCHLIAVISIIAFKGIDDYIDYSLEQYISDQITSL